MGKDSACASVPPAVRPAMRQHFANRLAASEEGMPSPHHFEEETIAQGGGQGGGAHEEEADAGEEAA